MPFQIFVQAAQAEPSLLEQAIIVLQRLGFFTVVIPFILVFAVIFAILEKSKLLGDDKRAVNAIVALVVALATTGAAAVTGVIGAMIPLVVLSIIVLLLFFLVYGLFAGDISQVGPGIRIGFGIAAGIAVALIFMHTANLMTYFTGEVIGIVLLIAVVIAVIGVIVGVNPQKS